MENTAATRQATRTRIGPWFVLQTRNPASPGMKYATLITLIQKGQITFRSVIRGPTTHQLWRFASRVKGISREFGLCYSCGSTLQRTAVVCSRCSKSQELPLDSDSFLEADTTKSGNRSDTGSGLESAAESSVMRSSESSAPKLIDPTVASTTTAAEANRAASMPPERTALALFGSSLSEEAIVSTARATRRPLAGAAATAAENGTPATTPVNRPSRDLRPPKDPAQKMNFAPLALALIMLAGVGVGLFFFVPQAHDQMVQWYQMVQHQLAKPSNTPANGTAGNSTSTAGSGAASKSEPAVSSPVTPTNSSSAASNGTSNSNSTGSNVNANLTPSNTQDSSGSGTTAAPSADASNSTTVTPTPRDTNTTPAPVTQNPAATSDASTTTPPTNVTPTDNSTPPAADSSTPAQPPTDSADSTADNGDLDTKAMHLRADAIDCEARKDYSSAEYFYEQIERLPRDHWPADTEQRLAAVRAAKNAATAGK